MANNQIGMGDIVQYFRKADLKTAETALDLAASEVKEKQQRSAEAKARSSAGATAGKAKKSHKKGAGKTTRAPRAPKVNAAASTPATDFAPGSTRDLSEPTREPAQTASPAAPAFALP